VCVWIRVGDIVKELDTVVSLMEMESVTLLLFVDDRDTERLVEADESVEGDDDRERVAELVTSSDDDKLIVRDGEGLGVTVHVRDNVKEPIDDETSRERLSVVVLELLGVTVAVTEPLVEPSAREFDQDGVAVPPLSVGEWETDTEFDTLTSAVLDAECDGGEALFVSDTTTDPVGLCDNDAETDSVDDGSILGEAVGEAAV
jgi:hypothetical protein